MKPRFTIFLVAFVATAGLGSCDSTTGPGLPGDSVLALDPNAGTHLLADAAHIDSAWTDADTLRLAVTYGGGCEEHDFRLVGARGFSGEYPFELPVYLVHDGHGDNCRALISETVSFDMSPAHQLFRQIYGRDDLVAFQVHTKSTSGQVVTTRALLFTGLTSSPRENVEADQMAMFLSGELYGPEDLYLELKDGLARVREEHGDKLTALGRPVGDISFRLPWVNSQIIVGFEPDWADSARAGNYPYWDALNQALGLEEVSFSPFAAADWAVLSFRGTLHPCVLASLYDDLPGVRHAEPNWLAGDWPKVYPRDTETGTTFLVNEAWGDCPAGCINNEFWYFEVQSGQVVFRGKGSSLTGDWGNEAVANVNLYNHLRQCNRE